MRITITTLLTFLLVSSACADGYRSGTLTDWGNRGILITNNIGSGEAIDGWNPNTNQIEGFGVNGSGGQWNNIETMFAYFSTVQIDGQWNRAVSIFDTATRQSTVIKTGGIRNFSWGDNGLLISESNPDENFPMEELFYYDFDYGLLSFDVIGHNGSHDYGLMFNTPIWSPDGIYYSSWTITNGTVASYDIWFLHGSGNHYKILENSPDNTILFGIQNGKLYYGSNDWISFHPEKELPGHWTHKLWSLDLSTGESKFLSSGAGDVEGISPDGTRFYSIDYIQDQFGYPNETRAIVSLVPEPTSLVALGGLIGMIPLLRRKR